MYGVLYTALSPSITNMSKQNNHNMSSFFELQFCDRVVFGVPWFLGCIHLYINDLNRYIKFSTTRHFADGTNLLHIKDFFKLRNRNPVRKLNIDVKSLNQWLLANKISMLLKLS